MRCHFQVLALALAAAAQAQSFTRDWRPEDRTVVGDFSRVLAIAASPDRVFIASWTLGPNLSALRLSAVRQ